MTIEKSNAYIRMPFKTRVIPILNILNVNGMDGNPMATCPWFGRTEFI
jgi:hypothetical protein